MICYTMASNGSTSRKEDTYMYLANLIIKGKVKNLKDLETEVFMNDALGLFEANEDGKTPLMVACLKGYKDIVEFLLEEGANPNEKDAEEMNTPLHFACQYSSLLDVFSPTMLDNNFLYNENCHSKKKDIVQLLYDHGAEVYRNSCGFMPLHCAALFGLSDLIDYFMNKQCMTNEDRLKALELLGMSQTLPVALQRPKYSEAHRSFLAANLLRHELGCHFPTNTPTELETGLGCRECTTFVELQKIKSDEVAMFIQGILVGERILPDDFKEDCLWVNLFYPNYNPAMFIRACSYGLKLESANCLTIATVLVGLQRFIYDCYDTNHQDIVLYKAISCLEMYPNILTNAECDSIVGRSYAIAMSLGGVVAAVIVNSYSNDIFEKILEAAAGVLKVFGEKTLGKQFYHSATLGLLERAIHTYEGTGRNDVDATEKRNLIVKLNYALLSFLRYELPNGSTVMYDEPILHLAIRYLSEEQDFDVVYSIVHTLLRHGSLPEEKFHQGCMDGCSAKDLAVSLGAQFQNPHPELDDILALLSTCNPTQPLPLQELAARSVIKHMIPYSLLTVPATVYNFLRGDDFYQTLKGNH